MCGRYTNTAGVEELNDHLGFPIEGEQGTRRYNIAPTEEVLAIVAPDGRPQARMLRWGLIPPGSTDMKAGGRLMINARMETVASKRPFAPLLGKASRRALQIADGYFEWLAPERRGEPRQPFYFQLDGGAPFAFAALWTPAKVAEQWVHSITMLTCDASPNHLAAAIHARMPVILADAEARRAWLDPALEGEDALALCHAMPESRLSARPANPAVNRADPEREGPELLLAPA